MRCKDELRTKIGRAASSRNRRFLLAMSSNAANSREHLQKLSTRAYLDETVTPLMMQALAAVARDRPEDPIDFVAHYLLKHNPRRVGDAQVGRFH
jgi:protein dpy-30